jgi:hypothetical protein
MDRGDIQMTDDQQFSLPTFSRVARFPKERFLQFCSRLKVQSKNYGIIPFDMVGGQRYLMNELIEGLERGITTFVILKARQTGITTFCIALDMFWAFEYPGLLGTFILHKEEARDDWRQSIEIFYDEIPSKIHVAGRWLKFKPRKIRHNYRLPLRRHLMMNSLTELDWLDWIACADQAHAFLPSTTFCASACADHAQERDASTIANCSAGDCGDQFHVDWPSVRLVPLLVLAPVNRRRSDMPLHHLEQVRLLRRRSAVEREQQLHRRVIGVHHVGLLDVAARARGGQVLRKQRVVLGVAIVEHPQVLKISDDSLHGSDVLGTVEICVGHLIILN